MIDGTRQDGNKSRTFAPRRPCKFAVYHAFSVVLLMLRMLASGKVRHRWATLVATGTSAGGRWHSCPSKVLGPRGVQE